MTRILRYERGIQRDLKRLDAAAQARILSVLERFAATGDPRLDSRTRAAALPAAARTVTKSAVNQH